MDSIVLVITGSLSGKNFSVIRLLAAGFLGGVYSCSLFFIPLSFLSAWIIKLMVSAVMVGVSFRFSPLKEFLRLILNFYISSLLLGGGLSAVFFLSGRPGIMANGIYYFPLSVFQLIIIALPLGVTLAFYYRKSKNRLMSCGKHCTVTIGSGDKTVTVPAIIDTGCSLYDPYSQKPVIIIPPDTEPVFCADDNFPFRLIPYSTIRSSGFMKAFSPDFCKITANEKTFNCSCSVAISPAGPAEKAIINPDIFNNFGGI